MLGRNALGRPGDCVRARRRTYRAVSSESQSPLLRIFMQTGASRRKQAPRLQGEERIISSLDRWLRDGSPEGMRRGGRPQAPARLYALPSPLARWRSAPSSSCRRHQSPRELCCRRMVVLHSGCQKRGRRRAIISNPASPSVLSTAGALSSRSLRYSTA